MDVFYHSPSPKASCGQATTGSRERVKPLPWSLIVNLRLQLGAFLANTGHAKESTNSVTGAHLPRHESRESPPKHLLDDVDRHDFLKTLAKACHRTGWQVHAYCLMSNHYH
jgi:hypothetical protein